MQIVRTIVWVSLLVVLAIFSIANLDPTVTVRIWPGLVVDTKIPAIVVVSFLIGFVPMWLWHRAASWQSGRKIQSLQNAARTAATTPIAPSTEPKPLTPAEPAFATMEDLATPRPEDA